MAARHRRGISTASDIREERMERCITVSKGRLFSDMQKTGTKRKIAPRRPPHLMEEIIFEILSWLPVKSLLRFRSECKAWRAIIDHDPTFIRAHLLHSASKWERSQCFVISPLTLDSIIPNEPWPSTFSNHFRFYQWQLQHDDGGTATLLDAKDFPRPFNTLINFQHCDGLLLAPTDTGLYLFNPATRDAIMLPDSHRNNLLREGESSCRCYCPGLGRDPSTGKYKVVQAFYRSHHPNNPRMGTDMGMEVFTVAGGGTWREITNDPPYPAKRFQNALAVSGFMFWRLEERDLERELWCILHLSLDEEEFGITGLPLQWNPEHDFMLDVLHGRDLCMSTTNNNRTILNIYTLPTADEGLNTLWEWRYTILPFPGLCHTLALPPFSNGAIMWKGNTVYCYEPATSELKEICDLRRMNYQWAGEWKNLYSFNVKPFTESLIRIT